MPRGQVRRVPGGQVKDWLRCRFGVTGALGDPADGVLQSRVRDGAAQCAKFAVRSLDLSAQPAKVRVQLLLAAADGMQRHELLLKRAGLLLQAVLLMDVGLFGGAVAAGARELDQLTALILR